MAAVVFEVIIHSFIQTVIHHSSQQHQYTSIFFSIITKSIFD